LGGLKNMNKIKKKYITKNQKKKEQKKNWGGFEPSLAA
jgi:hypothetical protein